MLKRFLNWWKPNPVVLRKTTVGALENYNPVKGSVVLWNPTTQREHRMDWNGWDSLDRYELRHRKVLRGLLLMEDGRTLVISTLDASQLPKIGWFS